jgi:uncharacterized protein (TIRG00374 family)
LGFGLSAFFLWLAFRNVDRAIFLDALSHMHAKWLAVALVVYLGAHVLRAFRWSLLLSPLTPITALAVFPFVMFGFLMNILLPGRVGEIAKSVAVSRRFSLSTPEVLGTVALERLGDLIGLLSALIVAVRVFPMAKKAFPLVLGSLFGGVLILFVGYFAFQKMEHLMAPGSFLKRMLLWVEKIFSGVKTAGSPRIIGGVALLSIGIWALEAATLMCTGRAFGLFLPPFQAVATLTGISMGVIIPASPGFVGTYEFFGKEALRLMGYPVNAALVFISFHHVLQMIVCALLGLPVLFKMGFIKSTEAKK